MEYGPPPPPPPPARRSTTLSVATVRAAGPSLQQSARASCLVTMGQVLSSVPLCSRAKDLQDTGDSDPGLRPEDKQTMEAAVMEQPQSSQVR